ncbi:MAG: ParB/RepB/Spo0J family partition protein [Oscillospiraceae bacterium]|nr:ParB/RepB/Spo0J family partition protein [Oscillospiraceae bacterium]
MKDKITNIPLGKLHPFAEHPYKVTDNEEMNDLTESIQTQGILSPLIVRPLENTDGGYEVISGHRRLYAAEKAGLSEVPAFIYFIDRDTAAIQLVDSNLHREHLLPSEKAYAYKLKLDAISRQGERNDLTLGQVVRKLESADMISPTECGRQIRRYIRLTHLIPELLELIDSGRIAFTPAVELSYLNEHEQRTVFEQFQRNDCTPSLSQACKLKKLSQMGELNDNTITEILSEMKPNQRETLKVPVDRIRKYVPQATDKQLEDFVVKACEHYHKYLVRKKERDR